MKKEYYVFGALAALFLLLMGYETYTFSYGGPHMMMGGEYMMGGMHMMGPGTRPSIYSPLFSPIGILLILLTAVFLYIILKGGKDESEESTAIKILKERYAKGEITRDEYLEVFKDIMEKE